MPGKPDYTSSEYSLWFTQSGEDAWKSLISLAESADLDNACRRARAVYNAGLLEGIGLSGFGAWGYGGSAPAAGTRLGSATVSGHEMVWNYAAAGLDTLTANVVGQDEVKPFLQVTDGDYDDHRQAIWSGRLLEGLYAQEQGKFHDVWDLGRSAFKIAAGCTGSAAVKVVSYPEENKLIYELHDTLDMFIDHFECSYSNPLTYGETTWFDPHRLMACFKDAGTKRAIWEAREPLPDDRGGIGERNPRMMVRLFEGWRLSLGDDPGTYLAVTKNGVLIRKDYAHSTPPFAMLHCRRSLAGFWGIPLMERGMRIVERIQRILAQLDKASVLTPTAGVVYDLATTTKEMIKNVKTIMQFPYDTSTNPNAKPPTFFTPPIYDQTLVNLLEMHVRAFQETLGISSNQMGATKAQGVVAAVAIRAVADLFTQLFAVEERDHQKFMTVGIGTLTLRALSDLRKSGKELSVNWNGGKFMKQVKSSVADLDEKKFIMQVSVASGTHNSPGDRIALADEMLARKELTPEGYQRVLETGDIPAETRPAKRQEAMIERAMDSWMNDELSEIKPISPLPWMNLPAAIVQVMDGYMGALMIDNFPPERELYFRRYVTQCDALDQRQQLAKAQLSGVSKGNGKAPAPAETPGSGGTIAAA